MLLLPNNTLANDKMNESDQLINCSSVILGGRRLHCHGGGDR